jgi:hypothetical protein
MKIHFAALVGVDYDLDLFKAWSKYYMDRKLDSYTVVLHREHGEIEKSTVADYRNAGFRVLCADGPFSTGCVRSALLGNIAANLPGDDILVTADADEFQAMNDGTPIDYRYFCEHYDILHGLHEDRYALAMERCDGDPFKQYPFIEAYTGEHLKTLTIPFINKASAPVLVRTKILAAPCGSPVEYKGSHCLKYVTINQKIKFDFKVIHFAWRNSASLKMAIKPYFNLDSLQQVFNNKIPESLIDAYVEAEAFMNPKSDFLSPSKYKGELSYGLQN